MAGAQTNFTVLTNFTKGGPENSLVYLSNVLYGTTMAGGSNNLGMIFSIRADGTGFTSLYSFSQTDPVTGTNGDGIEPKAGLTLAGTTLYGTAMSGGLHGRGTVFRINIDGTGFTNLHSFSAGQENSEYNLTNLDGINPAGPVALAGNVLFGVCPDGGTNGEGTVFSLNTDGTDFAVLHTFGVTLGYIVDADGGDPVSGLAVGNGVLYGTANIAGTNGNGTIFKLNTNGSGFAVIHSLSGGNYAASGYLTNADGRSPNGLMLLSNGVLYGTTTIGGSNSDGTVFKLNTDGSDFTVLHTFGSIPNDGYQPDAGVVLMGNTLYGTTDIGGPYETGGDNMYGGTVFQVGTDGSGYKLLHVFNNTNDGTEVTAGLVLAGNFAYGAASLGGATGSGTLFSLGVGTALEPVPLDITRSGSNVVLTWANAALTLQAGPLVAGPYTNLSGAASPYTNAIAPAASGTLFFRLSGP